MEVFNASRHFDEKTVVALGFFDGVHIAHRALIEKAIAIAEENNCKSVVYTFDRSVKNIKLITDNECKIKCMNKIGVDYLIFEEVSEDFLKTSPEDFVKNILKDKLNAHTVVVGKHYTFGYKGMADSTELTRLCADEGIQTVIMPLMELDDFLVSSTHVRFFIEYGEMEKVKKYLGRNFSITGEVEHGNHIGHRIGFPTVNIYPKELMVMPRFGVYAVCVTLNGNKYEGIANVGVKPTVGSDRPLVEAHMFDIEDKELYGECINVEFLSFIRQEMTFDSLESLTNQIEKDKEYAKEYFKKNKNQGEEI
ncbi:MAG: bifunctional riboflavin kinase/FAD synthetase [Clostridia bacterium]|nr:bifunctional riboflavin kinase/FAD synthetase [Clostridia bacterium]